MGNLYEIMGVGTRWFKFMARIRVSKGEVLVFRPLRRARTLRKEKGRKRRR